MVSVRVIATSSSTCWYTSSGSTFASAPVSSLNMMSRSFTFNVVCHSLRSMPPTNTVPMESPLVSLLSTVCTDFPPGFRDPPPLMWRMPVRCFPMMTHVFCVCTACVWVFAALIVSIWCLLVSAALQTSSALANIRSASRNSLSLIRVSCTPKTILSRIMSLSWVWKSHLPLSCPYPLPTGQLVRPRFGYDPKTGVVQPRCFYLAHNRHETLWEPVHSRPCPR